MSGSHGRVALALFPRLFCFVQKEVIEKEETPFSLSGTGMPLGLTMAQAMLN